jgi:hypothetical protein
VKHGPNHGQAAPSRKLVALEPDEQPGSVPRLCSSSLLLLVAKTDLKPIMSPISLMWCVGITITLLDGSCTSML